MATADNDLTCPRYDAEITEWLRELAAAYDTCAIEIDSFTCAELAAALEDAANRMEATAPDDDAPTDHYADKIAQIEGLVSAIRYYQRKGHHVAHIGDKARALLMCCVDLIEYAAGNEP